MDQKWQGRRENGVMRIGGIVIIKGSGAGEVVKGLELSDRVESERRCQYEREWPKGNRRLSRFRELELSDED